jgi:molybdopterin/thiamine biosynthesis adenylyltransferase
MNRQPFADIDTLGLPKVEAAAKCLTRGNPHVALRLRKERLEEVNAGRILQGNDVVVQGVDNVPSRVLLHERASSLGIPVVSMTGQPPFKGFVSTFMPDGPSFREVLSLPDEEGERLHEKVRMERANHAGRFAVDEWHPQFLRGEAAWAVTTERVYLMGVLQAHECVRMLAGREPRALAPKAFIVDLDDPESPVRLSTPPNGGAWDYREF